MRAVGYFREYYVDTGLYENTPYDGIEDALKALVGCGKKLVVATSKPEVLARRILAHFGLSKYFVEIAGATEDGAIVKKDDVLRLALSRTGFDATDCIMVGDRASDVIGAAKVGMDGMGVLYGYGSLAEFEGTKPVYIAKTVEDIPELLI